MKIRLDFVTNSSSSSFVCYAIRSPELAELIEACNCQEYIEACSFIETGPEGIVVNREIGAFFDVTDLDLHIDKLGLAVAIGDTESEYAANDFRYTEELEAEDAKKVLDWDMVRSAVEEFLDDDFDTEERILELIDELPADSVTCKIFEAQTDGDSFYGYDNFFDSPSNSTYVYVREDWMEKYGEHMNKNPDIKIEGNYFVFSGLDSYMWPVMVEECGGFNREKMSGRINYLIVNPFYAGEGKVLYALEMRKKGKDIKIVHIDDFAAAIKPMHKALNLKSYDERLEEILQNANENYALTNKRPETYDQFVKIVNSSKIILNNIVFNVYPGVNAEEFFKEKGFIVLLSDEEKLKEILGIADKNFEQTNKRPETFREFADIVGYTKVILMNIVESVHHDDAKEWLTQNGYIVPENAAEKLSAFLNKADEHFALVGRRPENMNQLLKITGATLSNLSSLIRQVHKNYGVADWLTENGYIKPMTDEEKLEFIYKKLKERYPQGSALPERVAEIKLKNSDVLGAAFDRFVNKLTGKTEKEWLTENGFLVTKEMKESEKAKEKAEKSAKAAAERAAQIELLKNVEKHDENILNPKQKAMLERTLAKLEEFYPEHKTYAMDSLCSSVRENAVILSKDLGYNSITEFLYAYGYEPISGTEVYELRKNCGYTLGNEPSIIKTRVDNTISKLNEYYPDHIIEESIQKSHSKLADTIAGLWQWLGYEDSTAFLAAYGFTYTAKAGGQTKVNPDAIIAELKRRYPEGTDMSVQQITADNKDLSIKTLSNTAHQLFGMKFSDYLYEQGILINPPKGYRGNKRSEKSTIVPKEEIAVDENAESSSENIKMNIVETAIVPEANADNLTAEANSEAEPSEPDDETILKEYTELLRSRIGTYPKKYISFEDLKFFNSDISFGALNRITIKLYGEKAIRYCTRMGFMKDKEEEQ